ncbi:NAD(P)-binding protein [Melanogaster broomeanus]|nr:NAD(P)-binding protein [Melanogaster broomeanus]
MSPSSQIRAYFAPESGAVDGDADKAVSLARRQASDAPWWRLLLNKGIKVVATLRNPDARRPCRQIPTSELVVVKLDVTQSSDVLAAFEKARQAFGKIDVVFNNAGQTQMGRVEAVPEEAARSVFEWGRVDKLVPEEAARSVFEVNFWGAANVTKEPYGSSETYEPPGGRLLQFPPRGRNSGCSCSWIVQRIALEGLSECFVHRTWIPAWNIKVTIIEPGPFRTKIVTENMKSAAQTSGHTQTPQSQVPEIRAYFSPESGVLLTGMQTRRVGRDGEACISTNPPLRLLSISATGGG